MFNSTNIFACAFKIIYMAIAMIDVVALQVVTATLPLTHRFQCVRRFDVPSPGDDDTFVDYDTIESENTVALASAKSFRINYQPQSQCRFP